jgi:hypothetical protein
MKSLSLLTLLLITTAVSAQTYPNLHKLDGGGHNVYFSENSKTRALTIYTNVADAEAYFKKEFNVEPKYTLLILSPSDWKTYAHPKAVYGIPHYLPDGRLVVAAENNDFWKRNVPPLDKIPPVLAKQLKDVYGDKNGEVNLTSFFDLLAVHELGHAFQTAAGMTKQRNWLNELLCNILLHTYIAENNKKLLPPLTVFPQVTVAGIPPSHLKYTRLEDFDTYYNEIAQNHPENYGWYQCRFHVFAGQIYDAGGVSAMKNVWTGLVAQKGRLGDQELMKLLETAHPAFASAITKWDK